MSTPQESMMSPAGGSVAPTRIRWLVLMLACGTSFFLYLHRYTWNFIAPELQNTHRWEPAAIQTAYVCFSWTYGLGQIPSGVLIDRIGPRMFLSSIVALWSLVIPLQASGSRWVVGLSRLALGGAQAGCYPGLAQVTARWFPTRYRTIVQGLIATVCGRGGGAVAPVLMATVLMAGLGLKLETTLWLLTGLGLVFATLFWTLFRDAPQDDPRVNSAELALIQEGRPTPEVSLAEAAPTEPETNATPLWLALRLRSVWMIAVMQSLVAGVDTIYSSLLGLYFLSRGVTLGKAGLLASIPLLGGMLGGVCAAAVNDYLMRVLPSRRMARTLVGLVGNLLACGAMLIMVRQSDATLAAFSLGAVKLFADMSQPIGWGACTDIGGRRGSATVFAIMNTGGNIGGVLFPMLFAAILARSATLETVDGIARKDFVPLFTVAAGIYVASGLAWLLIDSTKTVDDVARELRSGPASDGVSRRESESS